MPAPAGGRHDDDLVVAAGRGPGRSRARAAPVACAVIERLPSVLAGQAEHPLGQDVALDLVGAAVDRVGPGEEEEPLPLVEARRRRQRRARPAPARPSPARRGCLCQLAHTQLGDAVLSALPRRPARFSARVRSALSRITSSPTVAWASRSGSPGRPTAPLAVASATTPSSSRAKPTCWPIVDTPRSKPEQRHRDPPAVAGLADDQVRRRARAGEEHLVELRGAGELLDRPHLDARPGPSGRAGRTGPRGAASPARCGRSRSTSRPGGPARSTPSARRRPTRSPVAAAPWSRPPARSEPAPGSE